VPIMVPLAAGAMLLAARRASPRSLRTLSIAACGLGIVTLIGMAEMRLVGRNSGAIEFEALASLTDRLKPVAVLANYHVGGNLAMLRPDLPVLIPQPTREPVPQGPVLLLGDSPITPAGADAALAARGLAAPPGQTRQNGTLALRYTFAPDARMELHYQLIGP